MMMTAFLLCIYVGSSPRKAAKSLEVFNFMFHGLLGDSPCHTTIRTWLAKMGLDAIKHKDRTLDEAYAIIMDASISVGDHGLRGYFSSLHSLPRVCGRCCGERWL